MPGSLNGSTQPVADGPSPEASARYRWLAILVAVALWLAVTGYFWVGYVGADDLFYARYAFLFHRVPINWWEARLPAILAMRAVFLWLGTSQFDAALPTLLSALIGTVAIAWYVGWPQHLNWRTNSAMLLAITLPLDVTFRSVPGASYMAAGLLMLGSVCVLKGSRLAGLAGSLCFALGILTHEASLFYVAIFLGTSLVFDRKRFLRPALLSILFTLIAAGIQGAYYAHQFGDPLLRLHLAASESANTHGLYDPDTQIRGLQFLLWPLKTMIFSKVFACDLLVLFLLGAAYWRKLLTDQRIILVSAFLTWFYLGFGTKVPWAYHPFARMYHFYGPLVLGISVLLPVCIGHWTSRTSRPRLYAYAAVAGILTLHLLCLAAGGKWGQDVRVSQSLLDYASNHPSSTFLTDAATMNDMYVLNGFRLPQNVVCENGPAAERSLLVNKELPNPAMPHGFIFPERHIDAVLWNLNITPGSDEDFAAFLAAHPGRRERIEPVRYKPLFAFAPAFLKRRDFTIASEGADLVVLH